MIHLYTSRQYSESDERDIFGKLRKEANQFRLLCTKEWIIEHEFVAKGPYRVSRPKSVTSVRRHVTCPKCLDVLLPQAEAEVAQMKAAYEKNSGQPYQQREISFSEGPTL